MNNILSKLNNRVKGLHKSRFINPNKHWRFLIKFFLGIILILILMSFYFLYKIKNEEIFQNITTSLENTPSLINEKQLEKVNNLFNNKELKSIEIKNKKTLFLDPSI